MEGSIPHGQCRACIEKCVNVYKILTLSLSCAEDYPSQLLYWLQELFFFILLIYSRLRTPFVQG